MSTHPVVHFEMGYTDGARLSKFYSEVFGWNMQTMDEKMGYYILAGTTDTDEHGMVKTPGTINGGFYKTDKVDSGSTTHVVISVDNLKSFIEKVKTNGGEITSEVMDIPGIGTYASIKDTEGNPVGILQPAPMS